MHRIEYGVVYAEQPEAKITSRKQNKREEKPEKSKNGEQCVDFISA